MIYSFIKSNPWRFLSFSMAVFILSERWYFRTQYDELKEYIKSVDNNRKEDYYKLNRDNDISRLDKNYSELQKEYMDLKIQTISTDNKINRLCE